MPRTARATVGGICYHVINRGNGRMKVFHSDEDHRGFVELLLAANERVHMRLRRLNTPQTDAEGAAVRRSIVRGTPLGTEAWTRRTAERLDLESTVRPRGRPRKEAEK